MICNSIMLADIMICEIRPAQKDSTAGSLLVVACRCHYHPILSSSLSLFEVMLVPGRCIIGVLGDAGCIHPPLPIVTFIKWLAVINFIVGDLAADFSPCAKLIEQDRNGLYCI